MGTGQMLGVIVALVILGFLVLGVNRAMLTKTDDMIETQADVTAASVAEGLLSEACSKVFDQKVVTMAYDDPAMFTAPSSLGPDAGETYPNFNDVDDFKGYQRVQSSPALGNFTATVDVTYGNETTPDQVSTARTHYKIVTVTVTHPNLRTPIVLKRVAVKHH